MTKVKFEDLISRAEELLSSDPEESERLARSAVELARRNSRKNEEAEGLIIQSRAMTILHGGADAVGIAEMAVNMLKKSEDRELIAKAHNNLGICLRKSRRAYEAMVHCETALEIYREMDDQEGVAVMLNNMGITCMMIGYFERSYSLYNECIETARKMGFTRARAAASKNMAELLLDHDEQGKAEDYLLEALRLNREMGRTIGIGLSLNDLGRLMMDLGDYEQAEQYLQQAVETWLETGSYRNLMHTCEILSKLCEQTGRQQDSENHLIKMVEAAEKTKVPKMMAGARAELAISRVRHGKISGEEQPLLEALDHFLDSSQDISMRSEILGALSVLKEKEGEYPEALDYCRKKSILDVRIEVMERKNSVERVRLKAEVKRSESEKKLLHEQKIKLEKTNAELVKALEKVRTLSGMLPICSHCKKIRDDKGYWERIENYISEHSDAVFSHSLCPECIKKYYPEFSEA
ncbi:MAG: tetratricopeptide repeat protein [Candidatus Aegiribacteria sp.]|nr:tetratricopeptide repeat protein [Candidatus Aegiribacteria sp.]